MKKPTLASNKKTAEKPKASKDVPRAKKVSNPASTGGSGVTFENRVQAVKLLSLALGMSTLGIPEGCSIVELRFQARVHGVHTDDLLCTVERTNRTCFRILMQVKSVLAAQASNVAFSESVGGAWLDFNDSNYVRGEDRLVIVHTLSSNQAMRGVHDVVRFARSSISAADWELKLTADGSGNTIKRNALKALRAVVERYADAPVSNDELHQFARNLEFAPHDLEALPSAEHTNYLNQLQMAVDVCGESVSPGSVWDRLVASCMTLNAQAGGITLNNLRDFVGDELALVFETYRRQRGRLLNVLPPVRQPSNLGIDIGQWANSVVTSAQPIFSNTVASSARVASADKVISGMLDRVNDQVKGGRYQEALGALKQLGSDMGAFDNHQKARWYHLRAICRWHQDDNASAADDFLKAADFCEDDDKLAGARIRGLLLKKDLDAARVFSDSALDRFPESLAVWLAATNTRLASNDVVTLEEIPSSFRAEADAIQLVAWGYYNRGDVAESRKLGLHAMTLATANYFTRNLALAFVLQDISAKMGARAQRNLDTKDTIELEMVLQAFEPQHEKLWNMESVSTVITTVLHLAMGYILISRPEKALALLVDAGDRRLSSFELNGVMLEAHIAVKQPEAAFVYGMSVLGELNLTGLMVLGQLAEEKKNLAVLDAVISEVRTHHINALHEVDVLIGARWRLLARGDSAKTVQDEIEGLNLETSDSIALLTAAAHSLLKLMPEKAEQLLTRAKLLVVSATNPSDKYLVASLLAVVRRFEEAAVLYQELLISDKITPVEGDLLYCYVRSGHRAAARVLLQSLPDGWQREDWLRRLAMELGQEADDGVLLRGLVEAELLAYPRAARSWLFKLMVEVDSTPAALARAIGEVPLDVVGEIQEIAQLASAEIRFGHLGKGRLRLYILRRNHMSDPDAASALITSRLWGTSPSDAEFIQVEVISAGSSVTIVCEDGATISRVIDPYECSDLPAADGFLSPKSNEAQQLLGLRLNDTFVIKDGIGGQRKYTVSEINSAEHALLAHAYESLRVGLTPSRSMALITMGTDELGDVKLDRLAEHLQQAADHATEMLKVYTESPCTLGIAAKLMGRDVMSLVQAWPEQKFYLETSDATPAAYARANELLSRDGAAYVIDAATLTELGQINGLSALASLPKLYVSTKTKAFLRQCLESAQVDQSCGVASSIEGQLVFQEVTPAHRTARVDFVQALLEAVEQYCTVVPAYGPPLLPPMTRDIRQVVSEEEYSAILVALETDGVILALDSRLRTMAAMCGVFGVWPQALLNHEYAHGRMSYRDFSLSCWQMFFRNRITVGLTAGDLLVLIQQGGVMLNFGFPRFIEYIGATTTDFFSARTVVFSFFQLLQRTEHCQVGALLELVERLLEGLFRHKDCNANLAVQADLFFSQMKQTSYMGTGIYKYFAAAVKSAQRKAQQAPHAAPILLKVAYCSSPPLLLNGLSQTQYDVQLVEIAGRREEKGTCSTPFTDQPPC